MLNKTYDEMRGFKEIYNNYMRSSKEAYTLYLDRLKAIHNGASLEDDVLREIAGEFYDRVMLEQDFVPSEEDYNKIIEWFNDDTETIGLYERVFNTLQ